MSHRIFFATASAAALSLSAAAAQDIVHLNDVIIDGSLCVGFDCVNGEAFGFDTIRLKENNLRIKFQDTSTAASFPSNDWQITANASANGGQNKFSIDDITGGRTPFTIEANARSNSLYVDDGGRIGIRTSTPSTELHIIDGDTPTVRLQQDGSSGFAPQTWDMAGNETSFFIRDVTNGSQLPFRIRPGAPSSSIDIAADGDVGIGTASPDADLEISTSENFTFMRLTATGAVNDSADFTYTNGAAMAGEFRINIVDGDTQEMALNADGDLTITGDLVTGGVGTCAPPSPACDAVFDPAVYTVPSIEEHAALMWQNKYLPAVGPTGPNAPFNMTEKVLRMLNELEHAHIYIEELNAELKAQGSEIEALKTMLAAR